MFRIGEKGDEYVMNQDQDNLEDEFLKELDNIASICIAAMRWTNADEDLQIEEEKVAHNFDLKIKQKTQLVMVPWSVRGISKISFNQEPTKKPAPQLQIPDIIMEEK